MILRYNSLKSYSRNLLNLISTYLGTSIKRTFFILGFKVKQSFENLFVNLRENLKDIL